MIIKPLILQDEWPCDFCEMIFPYYTNASAHRSFIHGHLLPYPCSICARGFMTAAGLNRHNHTSHDVKVQSSMAKCFLCFFFLLPKSILPPLLNNPFHLE